MTKRTALLAVTMAALARAAGAQVVVVSVAPGQPAEKAGLRAGDRLTRWEQGDASGLLASPFDVTEVELERGPRGPVRVFAQRGDETIAASLFPDEWGLETRPELSAEGRPVLQAWERVEGARAAVAPAEIPRWKLDVATGALEDAARIARAANRPDVEAQVLAFHGSLLLEAGRLDRAAGPLDRALALRLAQGPDTLAAAALGLPLARVAFGLAADPSATRATVERLASLTERLAPESLARVRTGFALLLLTTGRDQAAFCAPLLPLADRLAPDGQMNARVLFACGWSEPDPLRGARALERAVAILDRRAPDSALLAEALAHLASTLDLAGDSESAPALYERGLVLVERVAPGSHAHANVLNRMAVHWGRHGDLVQAEAYFRRALEIDERQPFESAGVLQRSYNLGEVLRRRRDFEQAEAQFTRALELARRRDPAGALTGRATYMLGRCLVERGEPAAAEPLLRQALEIITVAEQSTADHVRETLGQALVLAGRLDEAEAVFRANLERAKARTVPFSLADRHQALGALLLKRGSGPEAEQNLRAALDLRRGIAPGSIGHAESAHELGRAALAGGRKDEARALFEEAVDALEAQGRRLGGSEETRSAFRAHYHEYYRDLEDLLLDLGRDRDAFEVVERSRARGLLSLIASRDLALDRHVPAGLAQELGQADAEHDRAFRALQRPGLDPAARDSAARALEVARRGQEDVRARVRASAPREAALLDPEPLDLPAVRRALAPGTLLLAFSLGATQGRVYAVGPGPDEFAAVPLRRSSDELRAEVQRFREVVHARRTHLERAQVAAASRRLSAALLGPVGDRLRRAQRVLVVPDGPLHLLPFAALQDAGRYLVESKTVEVAPSVTLYQTLAEASDAPAGPVRAVGFGDPAYAASGAARAPALTRALSAGLDLRPLPATRGEVESLRRLTAEAHVWTGPDATEEKAKALPRETRFVHFACHGFLDERFPLESGLALAAPGRDARDNGFLQAWEVFEGLRLDADQVTLSACQSGLGRDLAGEGLMGLTWAFLYAGARSVVASLWEVSDDSTAELMKRLYRHLARGLPRAEALRRAQAELLARRTTSSPYYWAAFTLIGDGGSRAGGTLAAP